VDLSEITARQPELFQQPASAAQTDELGREDFLTMLIAQLENQDPLDPQDATEFTAQLAQFSSLDQLVSMRQAIDSLTSSGAVSDGLAVASLIGQDALVESRELSVRAGETLPRVGLELAGSAEVLGVEVVDASGLTVATASQLGVLSSGRHELDWSQFDAEPPPGQYTLRVTTAQGDPTPTLLVRSTVTGAALDASGTVLLLGGTEVPLSSLREIGNGPVRSL
jgi:flagellar basal-body rod modification protein FlgD